MNGFTKGEWKKTTQFTVRVSGGWLCTLMTGDVDASVIERETNANLIATAGTTATKLIEQGYDAMRVLELLPEIISIVDGLDNLDKTKGGAYVGTLGNGTDVYDAKYYDEFEIEKLKLLAFELLEQCRGDV